jgi:hypothetical protein
MKLIDHVISSHQAGGRQPFCQGAAVHENGGK